jgi:hypothetical protein
MIVLLYDSEDNSRNNHYIMVEQELLQDTRNLKEVIFPLIALHYIFNLEYDGTVLESLLFLQEFILNLKEKGRHSAVYTAITS